MPVGLKVPAQKETTRRQTANCPLHEIFKYVLRDDACTASDPLDGRGDGLRDRTSRAAKTEVNGLRIGAPSL